MEKKPVTTNKSKSILPKKITTDKSVISSPESAFPAEKEINPSDMSEIKKVCVEIDMGLKNYLLAIKEGLSAEKFQKDGYGELVAEPDHDKRLKAALMGLEVEGYIKAKNSTTSTSNVSHVTYAWLTVPQTPQSPMPLPRDI
jgi:hypothetical protein